MTCQRNYAPDLSRPFDELNDETLLQALAQGAVWAMEPLYHRYHRILYALAYRLVVDTQIAEDLVQEAFLNLWQHAASYAPERGPVRRWLVTILYHRTIDYLRRYRRRHGSCKEVPWEEVEQDEGMVGPDVWEQVWHLLQLTQVHEALRQLPTEQRLLLELVYLQAWTHREIAEHYQLPLGTVKARIRLGLVHLRRALEQREGCNFYTSL